MTIKSTILGVLICLFCALVTNAQTPPIRQAEINHTDSDINPQKAHSNSAKGFANKVGIKLKELYPARIEEAKVTIQVTGTRDLPKHTFVWYAKIVSTTPETASYYFDRRGEYLSAPTFIEAKAKVEATLSLKKPHVALENAFARRFQTVSTITKTSQAEDLAGQNWYLEEHFVAASRTLKKR